MKLFTCISFAVTTLVLSGSFCPSYCVEGGPHRFPIGIYGVNDLKFLKDLKVVGFDSLVTGNSDPEFLGGMAKEAKKRGMRMVVYPDRASERSLSETKGWPIDAWYLHDEPDVTNTSAEELEAKSRKIRGWDPGRLQTFVIGEGGPAQKYGHIADILMLDWYPVPHLKLDSVADHIDLARKFIPEDKPLWMVVQSFDWRDAPQRTPKKARIGRFPNFSEIRFMSYLSIVHGARGLFYYTLTKPGGLTLFDYPEQWQATVRVVREISSLQPILEKGRPIELPFKLNEEGLEAKAWRYRGKDYVILLNRKPVSLPFPQELLNPFWRPLFEVRRDVRDFLEKTGESWSLRPYRVLVFESRYRWLKWLN